jgi:hypothetical protein
MQSELGISFVSGSSGELQRGLVFSRIDIDDIVNKIRETGIGRRVSWQKMRQEFFLVDFSVDFMYTGKA